MNFEVICIVVLIVTCTCALPLNDEHLEGNSTSTTTTTTAKPKLEAAKKTRRDADDKDEKFKAVNLLDLNNADKQRMQEIDQALERGSRALLEHPAVDNKDKNVTIPEVGDKLPVIGSNSSTPLIHHLRAAGAGSKGSSASSSGPCCDPTADDH